MTKQLLISFLFAASAFTIKAQTGHVIEADSTNMEVNSSLVELDTSASNIWQIGLPQKTFFGAAHSAPFAIMTDTINSYPINNLSQFTVSLDSTMWGFIPDAYISFWHKYETDAGKDGGYVEISIDSGATWANVINPYPAGIYYYNPESNFYSVNDTLSGGTPAFSGTQNTWMFSKMYLQWMFPVIHPHNDMKGGGPWNVQKVMFRFNFKSDGIQTNKAGWIIDNVEIGYEDIGGGIKSKDENNFEVHVFPNPMENECSVQVLSQNSTKFNMAIFNTLGEQVISQSTNNGHFYFEKGNLSSGLYFYSVSDDKGNKKEGKLIIK